MAACIFAHATGLCAEVWRPVLAATNPAIIKYAFDFKGHGSRGAELLEEGYVWENGGAEDVVDAVTYFKNDGAQGKQLIGVGHSFGGGSLVKAELANPGLFSHMVLCEPILFERDFDPQSTFHMAERALKRKPSWKSRQDAHEYLRPKSMFSKWDAAAFEGYLDGGFIDVSQNLSSPSEESFQLACRPSSEAFCFRGAGKSVNKQLGSIQCPVTIMVGGTSQHLDVPGRTTLDYYSYLTTLFKDGKMVVVDDSGHFFPQEKPMDVANEINNRFQQILQA